MSAFLKTLKQNGQLDQVHITLANIGSRKLSEEDDYGAGEWGILAPNLTIYGFDADSDACEAANADIAARQINWQEEHIPLALSNAVGEFPLYVTSHLACTSLYQPNLSYLERFARFPEFFQVEYTVEIPTTTLDVFCEESGIDSIDFLQIDVQGANLQVLKGASSLLERSVLGIQIEVEFSHVYKDQPLFADTDTYLRERNFTLFDLEGKGRYKRARSPIHSKIRYGQLLWADAYYFRDLIRSDIETKLKTPEQILKLACMADIMNFPDYALELLEYLTVHYGDDSRYNFANSIIASLSQFAELVELGLDSLPVVANISHRLT